MHSDGEQGLKDYWAQRNIEDAAAYAQAAADDAVRSARNNARTNVSLQAQVAEIRDDMRVVKANQEVLFDILASAGLLKRP